MKKPYSLLLVLTALAPSPAIAEGVTVNGSLTFASRYMSDGLPKTTGAALQPSVELGFGDFYAGLWASNMSQSLAGQDAEVDLSVGYRKSFGNLGVDLGYVRYYYFGPDVNCCGEVVGLFSWAPTEGTELGMRLAYDPNTKVSNLSVSAGHKISERFGVEAAAGRVANDHSYWQVGGNYALNESTELQLAWHDTNVDKGMAVLSVTYNFSLR